MSGILYNPDVEQKLLVISSCDHWRQFYEDNNQVDRELSSLWSDVDIVNQFLDCGWHVVSLTYMNEGNCLCLIERRRQAQS